MSRVFRSALQSDGRRPWLSSSSMSAPSFNSTRTVEALGLLEEIVRDYIQPLNAIDASQMEKRIEAHIEAGEALTPQNLSQWKTEVSKHSIDTNIERLAQNLKAAGYKVPDQNNLDRETYRKDPEKFRKNAERAISSISTAAAAEAPDGIIVRSVGGEFPTNPANQSREMQTRLSGLDARLRNTPTQNDMFKAMFCRCRLTKGTLKKFAEYDIIIPFGFLLVRPFMRYDMCSAILCKSGPELGETYMGHADFQLTDDVIHKTHIGHYTFYSKSVIKNSKLYTIAEDIFSAGYKGGEGTRFYKDPESLSQDIHAEAFRADIIAHLIPYRTNQPNAPRIQNPIDLTGKLHPTLYQDTDIPEVEADVAMYPGARYLAEKLELRKLSSYTSDATEHFLSPFKYLNTVAFQGPQYYFSNTKGQFARIQGQGHNLDFRYAGCKGVVCGDMDYYREVQHSDESPI